MLTSRQSRWFTLWCEVVKYEEKKKMREEEEERGGGVDKIVSAAWKQLAKPQKSLL